MKSGSVYQSEGMLKSTAGSFTANGRITEKGKVSKPLKIKGERDRVAEADELFEGRTKRALGIVRTYRQSDAG